MQNIDLAVVADLYARAGNALKEAHDVAKAFSSLGMTVPEPLDRLVGDSASSSHGVRPAPSRATPTVPPMPQPPRPVGVPEDWIAIPIRGLQLTNVVLGVLRQNGANTTPLRNKDIITAALELQPDAASGTIANIGSRLQGELIDRTEDGWRLIDETRAPILDGAFAWGPAKGMFKAHELAAYRREAIRHILGCSPQGLMRMEIVRALNALDLPTGKANKDLVGQDLESMEYDEVVRRVGKSRKWKLRE